ncbi:MAG: MFS transporter, partial [Planctomycetes bacterium]|nr:MFS transporter [Planctomycetota bacterium]
MNGCLAAVPAAIAIDDPVVTWTLAAFALAAAVTLGRELRHVPKDLLALMATAFLDMAGLFFVLPILPFYVTKFLADGDTLFGLELGAGTLTGFVMAAFTLAQSATAPFWGRMSDRRGRRPALLVALAATAFAYVLFGLAESLLVLVLARLVQGAGGGTVGVIQAYVTDVMPPEQRARALGWLSAATNLGVALGPAIGSWAVALGDVDLWPGQGRQALGAAAPGFVAAAACVANFVFVWCWLPEPVRRVTKPAHASPWRAAATVVAHPRRPAARILFTYGIAIGAAQGVHFVLTYFLEARFGVTKQTIGRYFLYIGAWAVFARTFLLGRAVARFGELRLSRVGLVTLAIGLATIPFTASVGTLALASALVPLGTAMTFPCVT